MDNAIQRLANAIHFVIYFANLNNLKLNATLTLKIIFFAEVRCLDALGELLTGVKMIKAPYGPIPDHHEEAIKLLISQNKIKVDNKDNNMTYKSISDYNSTNFNNEKQTY
jgi:hypothetical protein